MPLTTAPTEDPSVAALFETARLEASANGKLKITELTLQDLQKPGRVEAGDKLIIHRAAQRDVDIGAVALFGFKLHNQTQLD